MSRRIKAMHRSYCKEIGVKVPLKAFVLSLLKGKSGASLNDAKQWLRNKHQKRLATIIPTEVEPKYEDKTGRLRFVKREAN